MNEHGNSERFNSVVKSKLLSLFSTLVVAGLLGGCNRKLFTNPRNWFIESYDNGVITVQHEGNTYKATCVPKKSFTPEEFDAVETDPGKFSACETVIELVGHEIQPFEGKQRDVDGRIVVMWNIGGTLTLRSWRDDMPWRQGEFRITSVTKTPR